MHLRCRRPRCCSVQCHTLLLWPWGRCMAFLQLDFLICELKRGQLIYWWCCEDKAGQICEMLQRNGCWGSRQGWAEVLSNCCGKDSFLSSGGSVMCIYIVSLLYSTWESVITCSWGREHHYPHCTAEKLSHGGAPRGGKVWGETLGCNMRNNWLLPCFQAAAARWRWRFWSPSQRRAGGCVSA